MKYLRFEFSNFKGIHHLELDLAHPVTTLIGLNESGKTTILEAIFCFTYGAESLDALDPSMASLRDANRWIPIAQRGNFNDDISIVAEVALSDNDKNEYRKAMLRLQDLRVVDVPDTITITERYSFENSKFKNSRKTWNLTVRGTKGRQKTPRVFPGTSDEWKSAVGYLKDQLPAIWYFPNFLFELPERFTLEETAGTSAAGATDEREKNAFYRLTFERVLEQIGSGATLDTHIVDRISSSDRTDHRSLSALLLDMGREITNTVFEGWNRIFGRSPSAQEVSIHADADETEGPYLELKIKGPDGYYDLSERSLGFRWFFMFLLMTSYRGLSHSRSGVVFLLDEPASNLHSSAQAELLKSFESLAESCQLVYTTHSQHMINVRWLDSAYVISNDALGDLSLDDYLTVSSRTRTSISATPYRRFVADNPTRTSYFQPVLDVLNYRPSSLELVPDAVFVEGKSDFFVLRYIHEVKGIGPTCNLIPGLGAGALDPLIRLYIGWAANFVVLLDGDKEGRKQAARYEREFGSLVTDRIVTLSDLLDGAEEIESVFEPEDQANIVEAVFGAGASVTKKSILGAITELYASKRSVALSAICETRATKVLTDLVSHLQRGAGESD